MATGLVLLDYTKRHSNTLADLIMQKLLLVHLEESAEELFLKEQNDRSWLELWFASTVVSSKSEKILPL